MKIKNNEFVFICNLKNIFSVKAFKEFCVWVGEGTNFVLNNKHDQLLSFFTLKLLLKSDLYSTFQVLKYCLILLETVKRPKK